MSGFAELLRRFRESRSLTQGELAARAGLTPKAVGALERGERRRPFPHTVRALADALELNDADRGRFIAAVPPPSGRAVAVAAQRTSAPDRPPTPRSGRAAQVIGRENAVEAVGRAVVGAVTGSGRSIVTLTGPGGVGKTTLAQLAAAAVRESHSLDVVVVELADVRDAAGVVPAVAAALGVPDTADSVDSLAAVVGGRQLLLVLDNVEHVLACVSDVIALTAACPALGVLATSRVPMRVRAEREVRVAPLDHDMSVQLFRERWNAAGGADVDGGRDDAAVARLCRRADGLPLALELTAVAASRFGLRTLLASIDAPPETAPRDLPQRQRSMTATLDWSARLLSEPARTLLARLSVCVGRFTWFDARSVGGLRGASANGAFAELVEHSLVVRGDDGDVERFRLLEPVRQYAAGHLEPAEADAARAGLADAVLATARDLVADLHGPGQLEALQRLEAGLGNLRVALDQLISSRRCDDAAELLWLVWLHLAIRGHAHEGGDRAARLHPLPLTRRGRVRLLIAWAGLEHLTAPESACRRAREALALATGHADDRAHDDRAHDEQLATQAATLAASTALFSRDIALADDLLAEANRRADELGDPYWVVHARMATTQIALLADRASEAEAAARAAETAARRLGSVFETGAALNLRAVVAQRAGRDAEAAVLLAEAIELAVAAANSWTLTYMLSTLAAAAVRLGDPEAGARLFGAWSAHASAHGVVEDFPTTDESVIGDVDRARRELGVAAFDAARRHGREAGGAEIVALARRVRDRAEP